MEITKKYLNMIKTMEIMQDAQNIYRTPEYIVSQKISIILTKQCNTYSFSEDTYYLRNEKRDADFEYAFQNRDHLEGRRIQTHTHVRRYID